MKISIVVKQEVLNLLFEIFPLLMLTFNYVFGHTFLINKEHIVLLRVIAVFILLCNAIFRRGEINNRIILCVIFGTLLLFHGSVSINFLGTVIIAWGTTKNLDEVVECLFKVSLVGIAIYVACMYIGIIDISEIWTHNDRVRYTLGMGNPNLPAMFFTSGIFLYLLYLKKHSVIEMLISLCLSYIIFQYTDSRTAFFSSVIYVSLLFFLKHVLSTNLHKRIFSKILSYGMVLLFIIHLLGFVCIDLLMEYDVLLSYRVSYYKEFISKADLTDFLFGGLPIQIDSSYYSVLLCFGFFVYLAFVFFSYRAAQCLIDRNKFDVVVFLFVIFVYGVFESFLTHPEILMGVMAWRIILNEGCSNYELQF